ncbi:MAG: nucleotidyltransferase family protein [Tissierellia bacterium]|nr:nucleotidyltransferase family protein [Tissierellia bacterium]
MMIFAIISEYNPMHMGHIYQINRIKKHFPDAYIISLTSGSFVQRGEPSFISKHSKSKIAVENGIDLFLEMPTIISCQSANFFAFYSIKLLNKLNILDYVSFGVENVDSKIIDNYINFTKDKQAIIDESINCYMKEGLSYKASYLRTYKDLDFSGIESLSLPNNTLALQYALALDKIASDIKIYPIKRKVSSYHQDSLNNSNLQSATAIRKQFKKAPEIWAYLPKSSRDYIGDFDTINLNHFSQIFYYEAFVLNKDPSQIASYENGMLNLLKQNFQTDIGQMIDKSHNKRYSKSRLRRFIINYLLDIKVDDISNLDQINYIRPLAFNDKGRQILRLIKENSQVKIINSLRDVDDLDLINKNFLSIDQKAFRLFNLNTSDKNILDYTTNPYIK